MMRLSDTVDRVRIEYENIQYSFDRNEQGYATEDLVLMTLKKHHHILDQDQPVPCALCNVTIVYFDELRTEKPPSNPDNYICFDCYQKIID